MTFGNQVTWTDERIERLKELHADKLSAGRIAHEFGVTRNSICGKLHRLGLQSNGSPRHKMTRRVPKARPSRERARPRTAPTQRAAQLPASSEFLGIPFVALERRHCRYPKIINGVTLYCGQPKIEESSYCWSCHQICYQPAQPHRRVA